MTHARASTRRLVQSQPRSSTCRVTSGRGFSEYPSGFYEDHQIEDVIKPVKGGKEATVYCCLAGPSLGVELVAAKLYRPRIFRNLRNDSLYRMGRDVMDEEGKRVGSREARGLQKNTRFGQGLRQSNWLENEVSALRLLNEAGADVPHVYTNNDHALLMDYLGDADWPAPILQNADPFEGLESRTIFDRLLWNIELMLSHKRIHGDLSAHNILYWQNRYYHRLPTGGQPRREPLRLRDIRA